MTEAFLNERNAVVTGGTKGIGFAIAKALSGAGANVVICGRTGEGVDNAVRQLTKHAKNKVAGKVADVRSSTEVADLFAFADQELSGLDILVNNAGLGIFRSTQQLTIDEWHTMLETNLSGTFYCSKEALGRMMKRGAGYIINIGSLAGKNAFAGAAGYNASKFGLRGFTEAMLLDHRYDNVRVSHIMPGSVDTDFSTRSGGAEWKIAPEDIGQIVLMLLRMPERTLVSQVEVRPSKPKK
ncbi:MAG TPA: SDR family oxidoreductase [Bryobacteraceae bacterium]|nr:SDR family oxidoreductase [Bryobacteraceae bacterium]